jgi:hypothetical protein
VKKKRASRLFARATLHIRIVYVTEDFLLARPIYEDARDKIKSLFAKNFGEEDKAVKICLESCEAIADSEIRLDFIRTADQWRVEHLSFDDAPGEFLQAGSVYIGQTAADGGAYRSSTPWQPLSALKIESHADLNLPLRSNLNAARAINNVVSIKQIFCRGKY